MKNMSKLKKNSKLKVKTLKVGTLGISGCLKSVQKNPGLLEIEIIRFEKPLKSDCIMQLPAKV